MRRLSLVLILFVTLNSFGQVKVRTWLSDDTVHFAQATQINVEVITQPSQAILFPEIPDTLTKDLETGKIDIDTSRENNLRKIVYHIQIFPFKDTIFYIPGLPFKVGNEVYTTDSLKLVVLPMEIDSAQIAKIDTSQVIDIFDVKPPINPKLTWRELWLRYRYWLLALILLALLGYLIYWLYKKYRNWKETKDLPEELQLPPHELALKRLKQLESKRLYQQGNFKEFYAELSEIIRAYIERRFYIRALEATTTELKILLKASDEITSQWRQKLVDLFETADLAKFADYKPYPDIAQEHLRTAYNFIEDTIPHIDQEQEQDVVNQENLEQ